MGIMSSEWSGRLQHWMRTLKDDFYRPLGTISWEAFRTMEHLSPEEAMKGQFEPTRLYLGKNLGILLVPRKSGSPC